MDDGHADLCRALDPLSEDGAVLHAVNPDAPDSPMAIMKQTLTTPLKDHSRSQAEAPQAAAGGVGALREEVREALVRWESKRAHDQKSPRGEFEFEDALVEFVTGAVRGAPCVVEATGNTAGLRTRCKKGDLVVRFTGESAFDGASYPLISSCSDDRAGEVAQESPRGLPHPTRHRRAALRRALRDGARGVDLTYTEETATHGGGVFDSRWLPALRAQVTT
jgi:hypothetical protein